MQNETGTSQSSPERHSLWRLGLIVFLSSFLAMLLALWMAWHWFFQATIQPVELNPAEAASLQTKVSQLGLAAGLPAAERKHSATSPGTISDVDTPAPRAEPSPYRESAIPRTLHFTERELNALVASETDLGHRLALDLSQDLISATLVMPLQPDFPLLGGKTLRASAGVELREVDSQLRIALTGVSLWGVPLPDAWIGDLRNVDLAGSDGAPFWRQVAKGIDSFRVIDGQLEVTLKAPARPAGAQ